MTTADRFHYFKRFAIAAIVWSTLGLTFARGQEPAGTPTTSQPATSQSTTSPAEAVVVPSTGPTTQPTTSPSVGNFSLSELVDQSETTSSILRKIEGDLATDTPVREVDGKLQALTVEITAKAEESAKLLSPGASLETLNTLEGEWTAIRRQLLEWQTELAERGNSLRRDEDRLIELFLKWRDTLAGARAAGVEASVVQRVESIVGEIARTRGNIGGRLSIVWSLQTRITAQDLRANDALSAVKEARAGAVNRLLERDSPPLWDWQVRTQAKENLAADTRESFRAQWTATQAFMDREAESVLAHVALIAVLAAAVIWMRRRWDAHIKELDAEDDGSTVIFQMPVAVAMVATVPLISWFYPQAPRLFGALVGGAMLLPSVMVLRRLVARPLMPLLYALMAFYVLGLVVRVTAAMPSLSRTLLLVEMVGGALFLLWFLRSTPKRPDFPLYAEKGRWGLIRFAARVAIAAMTISTLANFIGFLSLARLIGHTVLSSAYIALIFNACVRVADALIAGAMHTPALTGFRAVRRHGPLIRGRVVWLLAWLAVIWWASITLRMLSLRQPLIDRLHTILTTPFGYGSVNLTLGGIVAFFAAIIGSIYFSRLVRFLLDEEVYPRVKLARGIPYAISTLLRYGIIFAGFMLAIAALGYDMSQFTFLGAAFGIGVGFGLQNIVNNFVSGLILLFERPIQVGDVIELEGSTVGNVSRIGIRASVLRTGSGAEIIVPNGMLIAGRVTNWTLSNRQRGFSIDVTVAGGNEPAKVIELLTSTARNHPRVATSPPPQVFVSDMLAAGGLKMDLHVWTDRFDDWVQVRSDVITAVDAALRENGVHRP